MARTYLGRRPCCGHCSGSPASPVEGSFRQIPRALVCDTIYDVSYCGHVSGRQKAYNLGFADGSVVSVEVDPRVGPRGFSSKFVGSAQKVADFVGYLEETAAGGGAAPSSVKWNTDYNMFPVNPQG